MKPYNTAAIISSLFLTLGAESGATAASRGYSIPLIDLASETNRQVIVDREPGQYLGHPTTVLLEDGKTIICVYPKGHGRGAIILKRSTDGGLTWSGRQAVPASWATSKETPTIHRVVDSQGKKRLIVWSGMYPARLAVSEDDGRTWSELKPAGDWGGIVVMSALEQLKTGAGNYLAMFHDDGRYFSATAKPTQPVTFTLFKTFSNDGGLTWSAPESILARSDVHLCEPGVIRSPDGKEMAVLLRENSRRKNSHVIFTRDEGKTWSEPRELPGALTGDRHTGKYAPDGRLFISFRDTTLESPTKGDWVGWVGKYEEIAAGKEGQYRVRLMKNYKGGDCAYPGVEVLADGTFVTTTYGHWTTNEMPYVASVRLKLAELDAKAKSQPQAVGRNPNIIFILADDLGYGDIGCYGASRVSTPSLDRVAREGLRFTDAHSSSATCTPSRYALLTGEYPWRKRGTGVLPGNAALVIDTDQITLPGVLRKSGYRNGVVGKWHLGLGPQGGPDWNGEIKPGPLELGFDYSFIMPATGDRVPCVYVEDHRVVRLDPADPIKVSFGPPIGTELTGKEHPELLKLHPSHGHDQAIVNGISRIGYMSGGKSALWKDEDMADTFTKKAIRFIEQNKASPFFLYFATHDIHVPRVPHPRFAGKSGCGVRGDVIVQFDWCVGQILESLDRLELRENTFVIISSDNGPVVDDGYKDDAVKDLNGHQPAGPLRGGKYSNFEGGTRVPLLVRWPGRIKPGVSDALVGQIDFMASLAALTGQNLSAAEARDSGNLLAAFLGDAKTGRENLVEQAGTLAIRDGTWKYIEPGRGARRNPSTNTEMGNDPAGQLYELGVDLAETKNLIEQKPEKARELVERLNATRAAGRLPTSSAGKQ